MSGINALSINEVEESKSRSVWCMNTTRGDMSSEIMFAVQTTNGSTVAVTVPLTFVAINLTEQVNKDDLVLDNNFRRAVMMEAISLISEEDAKIINSRSGAREELERLRRERMKNVGIAESMSTLNNPQHRRGADSPMSMGGGAMDRPGGMQNAQAEASRARNAMPEGVNAKVVAAINNQDLDEVGIVNRLRTLKPELTMVDANYMIEEGQARGLEGLETAGKSLKRQLKEQR